MIVPNSACRGPYLRSVAWLFVVLVAASALCAGAATAADDTRVARFPPRDRGPFAAIVGIGDGWPDPAGPAVELSWDIASHAMGQDEGSEALLLDGETHTLTLRFQRNLGERLTLAAELPWIAHGGGFMDDLIDGWHDAFGLSEGIRPELPEDDLRYVYERNDVELFRLDDATSGIGDVRTSAAWRLLGSESPTAPFIIDAIAEVDWATGDADKLTGNGSTDLAAGVRIAAPLGGGRRFGWALGAGVAWPGDVDLPLPPTSNEIWYYDASLAWAALPSVDLILQTQGHSGLYESELEGLGDSALQLGGGVLWRMSARYALRFGVFEDIRTDTMPDFTSELTLTYRAQ